MIILLTGTPGTGKSSVAKFLADRIGVSLIDINKIATEEVLVEKNRESKIVDIKKLSKKVKGLCKDKSIVEGHLSHLLGFGDVVIVLRTHPKTLEKRLREKGFGEGKIRENLEAEALDVCLIESLERHKEVCEIDTTEKKAAEVVKDIEKILAGKKDEFKAGKIDWSEEFF